MQAGEITKTLTPNASNLSQEFYRVALFQDTDLGSTDLTKGHRRSGTVRIPPSTVESRPRCKLDKDIKLKLL